MTIHRFLLAARAFRRSARCPYPAWCGFCAAVAAVPSGLTAAGAAPLMGAAPVSLLWMPATALALGAAGAMAVAALAANRGRVDLRRQLVRVSSKTAAHTRMARDFRAIAAIDPQCCIVWEDGCPRLAVHTLDAEGFPKKLTQVLRFASWAEGYDSASLPSSIDRLIQSGEAFATVVSTQDGARIAVRGGVLGPDAIVQFSRKDKPEERVFPLPDGFQEFEAALHARDSLIDALPFPVWFRDKKGALVWVNRAYASAVSAQSPVAAVTNGLELFEARERQKLAASKAAGRSQRLKTVVNGAVRVFDALVASNSAGTGGAALDAASLSGVEAELARQTAAHTRTLDRVSTGIAIFDSNRELSYANAALFSIWKIEETALDSRISATAFLDKLRQDRRLPDQANYRVWRDDYILGTRPAVDELWHLPDGRTVKAAIDRRDDGGLAFLFDDVTETIAIERRYRTLLDVQRETLDHLSEGIAVFASTGRLRLYNPAFQSMWGLELPEVENAPHINGIVKAAEDERSASMWAAARHAITALPEARDVFHGTLEQGSGTHIAYAGTPLPDGGTLLSFADITDSKRIEIVLLERSEALEAADRLKTAFLSHISYELRTPLTSIIGFTDLLSEPDFGTLTERQREYLGDIKCSSQVLLALINDIIDLAAIDAGAMDLKFAPVDVAAVVEAAELGVRERLARERIRLDVHIAEDALKVIGDGNRLTQVLYNLLSNAIGFSPPDSAVTLSCRRQTNGVAFTIQDTGSGIPEEEQEGVFERFEARGGSRHRGAGLGLSLVKSIVQLHNGRLELRSSTGAGTTVTVFFPDGHAVLEQPQPRPSRRASTAGRKYGRA